MIDSAASDGGQSDNAEDFRWAFLIRVHEVLEGGYRRLNYIAFAQVDEPAITGELRAAMNAYLRDYAAPDWADHFSVHDDPPVDDVNRKGKNRNRIDIRVDSATPRPGSSFAFEAKRLTDRRAVVKYLGRNGLGCFLRGDYARAENEAGMLGYVQAKDPAHWSTEIGGALLKNQTRYEVTEHSAWKGRQLEKGPAHVYVSEHARTKVGRPLSIYHTLLLFCSDEISPATSPDHVT